MQSLNEFVQERIRQCGLPKINLTERDKAVPQGTSRRSFLRSAGALIATTAMLAGIDAALSPYAHAANPVVYVDSGAGGSNNGTSWTNAYTTLAAAITASASTGSDFYVKNTHTETPAATYTFKGVQATPDRVFSCDATNSPPQTSDLLAGAAFTTATNVSITLNGQAYIFGLSLSCGSGNNTSNFVVSSSGTSFVTLDTCTVALVSTGTGSAITLGTNGASGSYGEVTFINTTVQFGNSAQGMNSQGGRFSWYNTPSAIQGATLPNSLIQSASTNRFGIWTFDGVDLSALTSKTIVGGPPNMIVQLIDCKLPATVTLASTPSAPNCRYDFITTDSTAVNSSSFIQTRYMYSGTLTADNTVYNNATDGVNPISWKVVTTANPTNGTTQSPFECFEIVQWAPAGTYAASTIVATSATGSLKTNDIWVEAEYLGTSGNPLGKQATTFGAGSGTAPLPQIPQGTSPGSIATGATWGTGGAGTNYTLAIPSFTTTLAGYVRFRVKVAKPSLTIWIDPAATIA